MHLDMRIFSDFNLCSVFLCYNKWIDKIEKFPKYTWTNCQKRKAQKLKQQVWYQELNIEISAIFYFYERNRT